MLWSDSKEQFDELVEIFLDEWEILEGLKRTGTKQSATYFWKFKLEDMREKMGKYIVQDLSLRGQPHQLNIPKATA